MILRLIIQQFRNPSKRKHFLTNFIFYFIALVYFNLNIFRGIQMSHERTRRKNTQRASEMNLAAILLCIVVVFIICHFPRILLNVHELFMLDNMLECGESGLYASHFVQFSSCTPNSVL